MFMKDDQQACVRFMLARPHVLSLDRPSLFLSEVEGPQSEEAKRMSALRTLDTLSQQEVVWKVSNQWSSFVLDLNLQSKPDL